MITKSTKKVYCIKDYDQHTAYTNCSFKKGNFYNVEYVDSDIFTPIHIYDNDFGMLSIHPESPKNIIIDKYLLTPKELRKKKLDKLK